MVPITERDWLALGAYGAITAVLLSPLRHYVGPLEQVNKKKNDNDSFPLSTYPMFSAYRRGRITVPHVIGITDTGERVNLHYSHFGLGGLNQTRRQLSKMLKKKRGVEVAQTYADALAVKPRSNERDVIEVHVVRSRFVFDDYFNGDKSPQAESLHATCLVGGRAKPAQGAPLPKFPGGN
ncbi:hypothetical protein QP027_01290 [Corynebacterium breve]|uniref:Uncharacterized protein n=1 Tax=Corynebacterium breve TaxID=3049799 RepID=A0ABY8VGG4_9CORY|nr:hypothetical protein [Corynebacterium breve]WIM68061.1 hypothetical protein QP027_01290 [Corynebacterium breve]